MSPTPTAEHCDIDGGTLEMELQGSTVILTCLRCGMSEKREGVTDGEGHEGDGTAGVVARVTSEDMHFDSRQPTQQQVQRLLTPKEQPPVQAAGSWVDFARAELDRQVAQLNDINRICCSAVRTWTALSAIGETDLPQPPMFAFDIAKEAEQTAQDAQEPPKNKGGRPKAVKP